MKQKNGEIQLLEVVALKDDLPGTALVQGQVGTVVEVVAPDVYEVEFVDDEGNTYAEASLSRDQLLVLHYSPAQAA